jgi:hypothetical protein
MSAAYNAHVKATMYHFDTMDGGMATTRNWPLGWRCHAALSEDFQLESSARVMVTWSRKTAIENVNGKHVTIGSEVRCVANASRDHTLPVKVGSIGKVLESGTWRPGGTPLGTKAAMKIRWADR